jgi:hypothetical protein
MDVELPTGRELWPLFLRRIAADYREGRATPTWEIPSIIAQCLDDVATRLEQDRRASA